MLDICESYDLAWDAVMHWSKSDLPRAKKITAEYCCLVSELEFEARQRASVNPIPLPSDME